MTRGGGGGEHATFERHTMRICHIDVVRDGSGAWGTCVASCPHSSQNLPVVAVEDGGLTFRLGGGGGGVWWCVAPCACVVFSAHCAYAVPRDLVNSLRSFWLPLSTMTYDSAILG